MKIGDKVVLKDKTNVLSNVVFLVVEINSQAGTAQVEYMVPTTIRLPINDLELAVSKV